MVQLEDLTSLDALGNAFGACARASAWKASTQRYGASLLLNSLHLREDLLNGTYEVMPTTDFDLCERGKVRKIEAPNIRDRVVQKVLMDKLLLPELTPRLIYDNYASLKGRGTDMARKRMDVMLHRYMRKHGTEGYILLIDIRKYFENISHEVLEEMLHKALSEKADDRCIRLINYIIEHSSKGESGLNLGSENPQIYAVYYLHRLDNYIKIVRGIKYYGRYMDDMFILAPTKEELKALLLDIEGILHELRLELNHRKTQIVKLSHGFTWLQIKYNITPSGHIVKRLTHGKVVRERRRLKAFRRKVDEGRMRVEDVRLCYISWRGTIRKQCNAYHTTLSSMDRLFCTLFGTMQPRVKPQPMSVYEAIKKIERKATIGDLIAATPYI